MNSRVTWRAFGMAYYVYNIYYITRSTQPDIVLHGMFWGIPRVNIKLFVDKLPDLVCDTSLESQRVVNIYLLSLTNATAILTGQYMQSVKDAVQMRKLCS